MNSAFVSGFFLQDLKTHLEIILYLSLLIVVTDELAIWVFLDGRLRKLFSYMRPWFILNISITLTLITLFNSLFNHVFLSAFLTYVITSTLAGIHITKFKILGIPLFFWDYIILKEPLLYLPTLIQKKTTWILITLGILSICLVFYGIFQLQSYSLGLSKRVILFLAFLFISVLGFLLFKVPYKKFFPANSYRDSVVFKTGLLPFLALTFRYSKSSPPPAEYSQVTIKAIQTVHGVSEMQKDEMLPENLPNIIVYSIESLMDLENLGVQLKNHPMPFFETLRQKTGRGFFVSPTFGGQTVQPEFELLTGLSQYQLSVPNPFIHIIDKYDHFPALPSTLKNLGYYTLGVQAVSANEFQRRQYYPILDFDRFIALESDYPKEDWEQVNHLLSDHYLIKKIKENIPSDDKPIFGLFLNNSTHASYDHWEKQDEFAVLNENISEKTRDVLERYASAINHADQALKDLVQYFQGKSKDTIFLIFGDHLPGLSSVFKDLQPFTGNKSWTKFHTPLRIMSTCEIPKKDRIVSANFLPLLILHLLDLKTYHLPPYFQVVESLYQEVDVYSSYIQDKQGEIFERQNQPEHLKKVCRDYDLIQYDLLEGQRYFNE